QVGSSDRIRQHVGGQRIRNIGGLESAIAVADQQVNRAVSAGGDQIDFSVFVKVADGCAHGAWNDVVDGLLKGSVAVADEDADFIAADLVDDGEIEIAVAVEV